MDHRRWPTDVIIRVDAINIGTPCKAKPPKGGLVNALRADAALAVIKRLVAERFGMDKELLLTDRRTRELVHMRQVAHWLALQLVVEATPERIAVAFGRDRTTLLHSSERIDVVITHNPALRQELTALKARVLEKIKRL